MIGDVLGNPVVEIEGPFVEDFTKLKWRYRDHRDGESAEFAVCGLHAYVQDCDGDYSVWEICKGRNIRNGRLGQILAKGQERDFWPALAAAETTLRRIVSERIQELKAGRPA